jgi:nucleotide-binding universal stress UspA family protein
MYQHILLPTDGSELSGRAVKAGVELAKKLNAKVTGFYAAPAYHPHFYKDVPINPASRMLYETHAKEQAGRYLSVIESAAKALGLAYDGQYVVSDVPHEAIIQTALDKHCDLIFMAPYGNRSALGLPLGSNTSKVLTHSKIPVLVHR